LAATVPSWAERPPGERNKRAGDGRWGDAKKGAVMKACLPLEASAAIAAGKGG